MQEIQNVGICFHNPIFAKPYIPVHICLCPYMYVHVYICLHMMARTWRQKWKAMLICGWGVRIVVRAWPMEHGL